MPATDLNSLSSIAASASGLEDTSPSLEDLPSRPTPPSGGKDELKDSEGQKGDDEKGEADKKESLWEWLTHKADGVKDWVDEFIHDHVPQDKGDEGKKDG